MTNPQAEQKVIYKSKEASQSIGKLVGALKAGAVLSKEVDDALNDVVTAEKTLNEQSAPSGRTYENIKDEILKIAVDIADKASALNSADKVNNFHFFISSLSCHCILSSLIFWF